jgi:uncharacterized glyoxalase superfamily protein PhnB
MPNKNLWSSPQITPSLAYEDVPRAVEWLSRAFGFRERTDARLSGDGWVITWMEIGDGLIHLGTAGAHGLRSPTALGGTTQSLKVYVADVDRHFEQAQAAGATIVSTPQDMFWGGRIYRATDHEGHQWEFSQTGKELTAEHWKLPEGVTRNSQNVA